MTWCCFGLALAWLATGSTALDSIAGDTGTGTGVGVDVDAVAASDPVTSGAVTRKARRNLGANITGLSAATSARAGVDNGDAAGGGAGGGGGGGAEGLAEVAAAQEALLHVPTKGAMQFEHKFELEFDFAAVMDIWWNLATTGNPKDYLPPLVRLKGVEKELEEDLDLGGGYSGGGGGGAAADGGKAAVRRRRRIEMEADPPWWTKRFVFISAFEFEENSVQTDGLPGNGGMQSKLLVKQTNRTGAELGLMTVAYCFVPDPARDDR